MTYSLAEHVPGEPYKYRHGWIPIHPGVPGDYAELNRDELDAHLTAVFHPQRLDALTERHPKSGWPLKVGTELRLDQDNIPKWDTSTDPQLDLTKHSIPARFKVLDHGPDVEHPSNFGIKPNHEGYAPIEYVYRGVSADEWKQAQERGYILSDMRGAISTGEGTNLAVDPRTAISYLPPGQHAMVLKIKVQPEHDLRAIEADTYVRSAQRISIKDVVHAEPYSKSARHLIYRGHPPRRILNDENKRVDLAEHVPGEPYKYRHGWIPVGATFLRPGEHPKSIDALGETAAISTPTVQRRLDKLYQQALDSGQADADRRWYYTSHAQIEDAAKQFGIDPAVLTAMVAATSPQLAWGPTKAGKYPNLNAALKAALIAKSNPDIATDVLAKTYEHPGMLRTSLKNAMRAYRGEPVETILRGPKVSSFYNNLRWPDEQGAVTIDGHMAAALLDLDPNDPLLSQKIDRATGRRGYAWAADQIRRAAKRAGVPLSEYQAAVWMQHIRNGGLLRGVSQAVT